MGYKYSMSGEQREIRKILIEEKRSLADTGADNRIILKQILQQ
jgi:hypothetical protein